MIHRTEAKITQILCTTVRGKAIREAAGSKLKLTFLMLLYVIVMAAVHKRFPHPILSYNTIYQSR